MTALTEADVEQAKLEWLPGEDSNLGQWSQSPLCCHYTTGQRRSAQPAGELRHRARGLAGCTWYFMPLALARRYRP